MRLPMNVRRLGAPSLVRRKLPLLSAANVRVAQIARVASFEGVKVFEREGWIALETYRPRVLVGGTAHLHELALRVERNLLDLSSVDHAVFALTHCGEEPLSDVLRVVFWQAFGVPVYELFMGRGGILACECEAHDGWHVEPGASFRISEGELLLDRSGAKAMRTGLRGSIETEICPCGREAPRLMNVGLCTAPPQQLAATA